MFLAPFGHLWLVLVNFGSELKYHKEVLVASGSLGTFWQYMVGFGETR